jgi:transposase
MPIVEFPQIVKRGCGLDVHRDTVVATVRGEDIETRTVTYGTFTKDIEALIGWLQNEGVTHVAMESTGVYWKPVYYVMEPYFELLLVNARHVKNVPGHKTDKKDSEWIAKLLMSGLLKKSFVPDAHTRCVRGLYRHRKKLINQRSTEKNRLQNILEEANIKLGSVISDVFGKTGQAILYQLSKGQTDPKQLAQLAQGSLVKKKEQLELALYGNFTNYHQFMLKLILATIESINQTIGKIEAEIDAYLKEKEEKIILLQSIPGVSKQVACGIIAEIGTDMEQFISYKHMASWAGICPGNNESAGKKRSSRTTQGNKYLKTTLIEAAWSASHTKNTHLAFKHHVIAKRRGSKKAAMAVGHKILIASYHILRDDIPYYEPKLPEKVVNQRKQIEIERLQKRLEKLKASTSSN